LQLPTGVLAPNLGLQVTSFAARTTIVNAVFAQADFVEALAQRAVLVTGAGSFWLVADHAHEFLGHSGRLSRIRLSGNGTMVDGLAVIAGKNKSKAAFHKTYLRQARGFIDPAKPGC
jgi:hypothetical protein